MNTNRNTNIEKFEINLSKAETLAIKNLLSCQDERQDNCFGYLHIVNGRMGRIETANDHSIAISDIKLNLPDGYYKILTPVIANKPIMLGKLSDEEEFRLFKYNVLAYLPKDDDTNFEIVIDKNILLDAIKNSGDNLVFTFHGNLGGVEIYSQIPDGDKNIHLYNMVMPMHGEINDRWKPQS